LVHQLRTAAAANASGNSFFFLSDPNGGSIAK